MHCDKSVLGVNQQKTQQWLLNESAWLTLQKAYEITLSLESAIQQAAGIQNDSQKENGHVNVFKVNKQNSHVSVVQGNTVPRCAHSSTNNVFIVKQRTPQKSLSKENHRQKCFSTFFGYRYGNSPVKRRSRGFWFACNLSFETQPRTTN